MKEAEVLLVDARAQVKAALEGAQCPVPFAVRQRFPAESAGGVVVTYAEYSNVSTDCPVVDELVFQVEVWAFDRETVNIVSAAVNAAMLGMGLKRVYAGPDELAEGPGGYVKKCYRFGRRVDKRWMRLVE